MTPKQECHGALDSSIFLILTPLTELSLMDGQFLGGRPIHELRMKIDQLKA